MSWFGTWYMLPFRCMVYPFLTSASYQRLLDGEPLNDKMLEQKLESDKDVLAQRFEQAIQRLKAIENDQEANMLENKRYAIDANNRINRLKAAPGAETGRNASDIERLKKAALEYLRESKRYENLLESTRESIRGLEHRATQLEISEINANTVSGLKAIRDYTEIAVRTGATEDEVRKIEEDIAAFSEGGKNIQTIMSAPPNSEPPMDDEELFAELNQLSPSVPVSYSTSSLPQETKKKSDKVPVVTRRYDLGRQPNKPIRQ